MSFGRWWGHVRESSRSVVREIDAVAKTSSNDVVALGGCKWTDGPAPFSQHELLVRLAPHVPGAVEHPRHYFFAREGFDDRLEALAASSDGSVRLVTPAGLFRE